MLRFKQKTSATLGKRKNKSSSITGIQMKINFFFCLMKEKQIPLSFIIQYIHIVMAYNSRTYC